MRERKCFSLLAVLSLLLALTSAYAQKSPGAKSPNGSSTSAGQESIILQCNSVGELGNVFGIGTSEKMLDLGLFGELFSRPIDLQGECSFEDAKTACQRWAVSIFSDPAYHLDVSRQLLDDFLNSARSEAESAARMACHGNMLLGRVGRYSSVIFSWQNRYFDIFAGPPLCENEKPDPNDQLCPGGRPHAYGLADIWSYYDHIKKTWDKKVRDCVGSSGVPIISGCEVETKDTTLVPVMDEDLVSVYPTGPFDESGNAVDCATICVIKRGSRLMMKAGAVAKGLACYYATPSCLAED